MNDEKKSEFLKIDDKCTIEFTKDGNVIIGDSCKDSVINPGEIQILDRVNEEEGNK